MDRILLTRELAGRGVGGTEIESLVRTGSLVRVRRGAYLPGPDPTTAADDAVRHRHLIDSTIGQCGEGVVVSHMSAALLHGLPTWRDQLQRVSVLRDRDGGGRTRRHIVVRGMPLHPDDVVRVDGMVATSVARTVVDLACLLSLQRSVAVGDAALRLAGDREPALRAAVEATLRRAVRRPGVLVARRSVALLDGAAESVGESRSRVIMHEQNVPPPTLQHEVFDRYGRLVGRSDFAWLEHRTLGEFDGAVKYSGQFGRPADQVVLDEKQRENALRDLGWQVVRWTSLDLRDPPRFAAMLRRRLADGRRLAL